MYVAMPHLIQKQHQPNAVPPAVLRGSDVMATGTARTGAVCVRAAGAQLANARTKKEVRQSARIQRRASASTT